ncbi:MAG: hypothetical protein ACYDER_14615, partial [Ktedonobacteraceae bacterium]
MKWRIMGQMMSGILVLWMIVFRIADITPVSARAVPAPTPHCGGWSIVPSSNPTEYQNQLYAVAAVSPTDVWAVGYD